MLRSRSTPGRSWITGRRLALLAFALAALTLDGCSMFGGNGGCSTCGKHRLFGRRRSAEVYAAPPAVEMPAAGAVITPGVAPSGVGTTAGGGEMETNPDLAPLPGAAEPAGGSGTGAGAGGTGGANPTQSRKPAGTGTTMTSPSYLRSRARRPSPGGQSLVRALPTFEPAPGPARRGTAAGAAADDLLNNLPPAAGDISPPAAPVAERPNAQATAPAPVADQPVTTASATVEARAPAADAFAGAAPGIRWFQSVEARVSGGSVPTAEGWNWLAGKGYKTALDLRPTDDRKPADLAAINHQGLRYVALPVAAGTITAEEVRRFDDEVAQVGARPLFFFDDDGARAAVLWYVHLVASGRMDARSARHEVEQVGRADATLFAAADRYLDQLAADRRAAAAPTPDPTPASPPSPTPAEAPAASSAAPIPAAAPMPAPTSFSVALRRPTAADSRAMPGELSPWKPVAALLLSALAVPLAFLGRSAVGVTLRRRARASLPAPAPSPSPARDGSGA